MPNPLPSAERDERSESREAPPLLQIEMPNPLSSAERDEKIFRRSFFAEVFRKTFFGSSFALETGRGHHVSRIKFKWAEARTKAKCVRTNIYDQFHYFGEKKRRFGVNAGRYFF